MVTGPATGDPASQSILPPVIEPPPGRPPAAAAILVGYGGDSPDMYYNTVMYPIKIL